MPAEDELYEMPGHAGSLAGSDPDLQSEVLDGELVEQWRLAPVPPAPVRLPVRVSPAVQTAAAAATGFVAGAATLALLRRYGQARLGRGVGLGDRLAAGRVRTYVIQVRPLRPYVE